MIFFFQKKKLKIIFVFHLRAHTHILRKNWITRILRFLKVLIVSFLQFVFVFYSFVVDVVVASRHTNFSFLILYIHFNSWFVALIFFCLSNKKSVIINVAKVMDLQKAKLKWKKKFYEIQILLAQVEGCFAIVEVKLGKTAMWHFGTISHDFIHLQKLILRCMRVKINHWNILVFRTHVPMIYFHSHESQNEFLRVYEIMRNHTKMSEICHCWFIITRMYLIAKFYFAQEFQNIESIK